MGQLKIDPAHQEGADLWDCPCRECTKLDWQALDPGVRLTLGAHRRELWPDVWGRE